MPNCTSALPLCSTRHEKPTITLKVMALCLKYLEASKKNDRVASALSNYLENNKWNRRRITDKVFTQESVDYADYYRNPTAHGGTLKDEKEAQRCTEITEKLIKYLISCMPKKEAL